VEAPPRQLDGAFVLHYVVSARGGFHDLEGAMPPAKVVAMAICRYEGGDLLPASEHLGRFIKKPRSTGASVLPLGGLKQTR